MMFFSQMRSASRLTISTALACPLVKTSGIVTSASRISCGSSAAAACSSRGSVHALGHLILRQPVLLDQHRAMPSRWDSGPRGFSTSAISSTAVASPRGSSRGRHPGRPCARPASGARKYELVTRPLLVVALADDQRLEQPVLADRVSTHRDRASSTAARGCCSLRSMASMGIRKTLEPDGVSSRSR